MARCPVQLSTSAPRRRNICAPSGPERPMRLARQIFANELTFTTIPRARRRPEREKRYVAHWPVRKYRLMPKTIRTACSEEQSKCQVSGVVAFNVSNPATSRKSAGTASFEYGIVFAHRTARLVPKTGNYCRHKSDLRSNSTGELQLRRTVSSGQPTMIIGRPICSFSAQRPLFVMQEQN